MKTAKKEKAVFFFLLFCLPVLSSCAQYSSMELYQSGFLKRAQTKTNGMVQVTAVVPTREESARLFGRFVSETGVQPVWIRIRNNEQVPYWLFAVSIDPMYFSPHEAARKNHFFLGGFSNEKMDSVFRKRAIYPYISPGETVAGFVYTRLDQGVKAFTVDLKSPGRKGKSFFFYFELPGFQADSPGLEFRPKYKDAEVVNLESLAQLRKWIEGLPPSVFGKDGVSHADPMNLVLVGRVDDIMPAFTMRGWKPAESAHFSAVWKTIKSFVFGSQYRYSPFSPQYLYGRKQDLALQKARETINERNHLRLWFAPARFKGLPILVGQISRDIGVKLTGRISPLTTHVIDPEVDEARWYLEQDLVMSQRVYMLGLCKGVGYSSKLHPRLNMQGEPYYTDGLRLVLFFTDRPISFDEIRVLDWETPKDVRYLHKDVEP